MPEVDIFARRTQVVVAGINPKFSCGALMGGGKPHDTPPSHSINITFDLFCIDDMQGSSRLKIKTK